MPRWRAAALAAAGLLGLSVPGAGEAAPDPLAERGSSAIMTLATVYLLALPMPTLQEQGEKADYMINVNTASEELLDCLGDGTDPVGSALVEEIRTSGPFTSREEVLAFIQAFLNIQENFDTSAWPLDVESNYFQISTRAEFGDLIMQMQHVVERGDNDIRVLMRSYGQQW